MIALVDYGAGNLTSVKKALDYLGAEAVITSGPELVARADKIILPGVGHFSATTMLSESGLKDAVLQAIERRVPFLGICLGMQWLFDSSQEAPGVPGLGLLPGGSEHFSPQVKSPHVGWNSLHLRKRSALFRGIESGAFMYFTHSYRVPLGPSTSAESEYGGPFSAAIERGHLFGVQFHPEKSGAAGLKLLQNFCQL